MVVGQGEVWSADLSVATGSGPEFRRPVVVVQGDLAFDAVRLYSSEPGSHSKHPLCSAMEFQMELRLTHRAAVTVLTLLNCPGVDSHDVARLKIGFRHSQPSSRQATQRHAERAPSANNCNILGVQARLHSSHRGFSSVSGPELYGSPASRA